MSENPATDENADGQGGDVSDAQAPIKKLGPSKILVVDDEPDLEHLVRQRMRREIRSGDYTFVFAHNGLEALDILGKEEDIDMVLSDINMPQMDGLTLLEQIPKVNPNIRSVIVSAYGDMRNIRTAMNRGAFDFITKPIDFSDMKVTIKRTLEHLALWRDALSSRDKLVSLQQELATASAIQMSILPTEFPSSPECQVFGNMQPARNVGGDFYDVMVLPGDRLGVAIADVSDKGVPAALFMMSCKTLLTSAQDGHQSPAEVLTAINEQLIVGNESMMFVTIFYGIYNLKTGELHYANGGHNPPVLVHKDGSSDIFSPLQGTALGIMPDAQFHEASITVNPDELVVLYTDGVTEAEDVDDELFGMDRLRDIFSSGYSTDAEDANHGIFSAVKKFAGDNPQSDDITCVTLLRTK